jgi:aerobic carbon-monoxide dehydrogenase large subunit
MKINPAHLRSEDDRLLQGLGRYSDDVRFPGEVHAVVFRSPYAHGLICQLDIATAASQPGVLAIYTHADLVAAGHAPFPFRIPILNSDGSQPRIPDRLALAGDRVRHVGEALAFVVAETRDQARDAADLIDLEIEELPVVVDTVAATHDDAPRLHRDDSNVCLDWQGGDADMVDAAFANATHVAAVDLKISRLAVASMEPRCGVALADQSSGRLTLHMATQGVWDMRNMLSGVLGLAADDLHVISENIGGSFGLKAQYHVEPVLLLHAARDLARPVRWRDERGDSFVSDFQARDWQGKAELALDAAGNFLALRVDGLSDMGAYASAWAPSLHTWGLMTSANSLYRTPLISVRTRCVHTNKLPVTPYRGAGQPEGNFIMERLVRAASRLLHRDAVDLRRQNMIAADQMPWQAASGALYDSGDFSALLDKALKVADHGGFAARKAGSLQRNRLRGLGLICYLKATGAPNKETGSICFTPEGRISLVTGTQDQGQGHATTYISLAAGQLGQSLDMFDLAQGDSDQVLGSSGSTGSKSTINSGVAFRQAATEVIEKGRQWASHVLEVAVEDIVFERGAFCVAGTDRAISLPDLAATVREQSNKPSHLPETLDTKLLIDTPPSTFPNGCHICEVEIDPETGVVTLDRYTAVDDFGTVINPMIVAGQVHGGIVQGAAQVLLEGLQYDEQGQLLTGSFMDYAMPRADDMPAFVTDDHPSPATSNPLGIKGCGEAGTTAALPCVTDALLDALEPFGVEDLEMPVTSEKIWQLLQKSKPDN